MVNPAGRGVPGGAPSTLILVGRGNPGDKIRFAFSTLRLRTSTEVAASILLINVARSYRPGRTLRMTNRPVTPSTVALYRLPAAFKDGGSSTSSGANCTVPTGSWMVVVPRSQGSFVRGVFGTGAWPPPCAGRGAGGGGGMGPPGLFRTLDSRGGIPLTTPQTVKRGIGII